jgi:hypothetical protein
VIVECRFEAVILLAEASLVVRDDPHPVIQKIAKIDRPLFEDHCDNNRGRLVGELVTETSTA